jgi:hypothetical protein
MEAFQEFVSLGSSCCIAYQLSKHKLRQSAYPFDWTRSDKIKDLTDVFKNDFEGYLESLEIISKSENHALLTTDDFPDESQNKTLIVKNKYGIKFYHDFDATKALDIQIVSNKEKYKRRIDRLYEISNNKTIHFIRQEFKPKTLKSDDINDLIKVLSSRFKNFDLTIIIHNLSNNDYDIFRYTHPKVRIIIDSSEFVDWQRSNINWANIFNTISTINRVSLVNTKKTRSKICINFHDNQKNLISKYNDEITQEDIVKLANDILVVIPELIAETKFLNYMIIEKSVGIEQTEYAIKVVFSKYDKAESVMVSLLERVKLNITLAAYQQDHVSDKYMITKKTHFNDYYDGTLWKHQIDSFVQSCSEMSRIVHNSINSWILKNGYNFLGLGGECGYYGLANKQHFKNQILMTSSVVIYDDCKLNTNVECKLIDYTNYDFKEIMDTENTILLVNVSKKGLQRMLDHVCKYKFKQILYIGCCEKYVMSDLEALSKIYKVCNMVKIDLPNNNSEFIVDLQ